MKLRSQAAKKIWPVPNFSPGVAQLREKVLTEIKLVFEIPDLTFGQLIRRVNGKIAALVRFLAQSTVSARVALDYILKESKALDQRIRTLLAELGLRHRNSNRARLYLHNSLEGIGFVSVEETLVTAIVARGRYFAQNIKLEDLRSELSATELDPRAIARKVCEKYLLSVPEELNSRAAGQVVKEIWQNRWLAEWKRSVHKTKLDEAEVGAALSNLWIRQGNLSVRNARLGVSIQDNSVFTKAYVGHGTERNNECRQCNSAAETTAHIVSECPKYRATKMTARHDDVARNVYAVLAKRYQFEIPNYSSAVPSCVKSKTAELYWNFTFPSTRPLKACKPDLVCIDHSRREILIIEVAVSWFTRLKDMNDRKYRKYMVNGNETESDRGNTITDA
ncbi:unnamed protein product [Bursaphelenchus xylophilus]|uniref:(pine wood nematode) hypothetical protein n=1 Tax=Bursaphelenchus xylophilus TaxID=6326 RepID=A0A1I7S6I9_BURXY|nr:unnamed protein product [Bursaphelenchus xylophilus]CAG9120482.1 unnamed protein product [Bursaphelenchus xylophilus]